MSRSTIAVVSDVHGNAVALDVVLADVRRRRVRALVCLGDVAAGGPQPREAIERLRSAGCPVVRGNTDEWLLDGFPDEHADDETRALRRAVEWARRELPPEELDFLRALPLTLDLELRGGVRILCFHGSPRSNRDRIVPTSSDEELDERLQGASALVLLGGHTHLQMLRRYRGALLVNVGSVGLPVGSLAGAAGAVPLPSWAEYAIVAADRRGVSVELCRVAVEPAPLERAARESGLPDAERWPLALERRVRTHNVRSSGGRSR